MNNILELSSSSTTLSYGKGGMLDTSIYAWSRSSSSSSSIIMSDTTTKDSTWLTKNTNENSWMSSLTPASPDQPPIIWKSSPLPSNQQQEQQSSSTLVQGLIYLTKPSTIILDKINTEEDTMLLLEIRNDMEEDFISAGARIPLSRVRFPMQFIMSEKNVLPGRSLRTDKDWFVKASICPSSKTPCSDPLLSATGLAKRITNLPGSEGTTLRSGASLGLK
jgi:hypothetical protein